MLVTRGDFLKLLGLAMAGARVDPGLAFAPAFRVESADPSHFQPHIGDRFSVVPANRSPRVHLTLARIVEPTVTNDVAQFSLVFDGASDEAVADGIHAFHHPALGSFEIFISRISMPKNNRRRYEACFSRHLRA